MPMTAPTKTELLSQYHSLQRSGFDVRLQRQAAAHHLPVAFLYAIASRETNCVNKLGDFQGGEYHGVGIVQIDIQHEVARAARDSGSWKADPDPLLASGAELLEAILQSLRRKFAALDENDLLKAAASAYNCGLGNALRGLRNGGDSDQFTTGQNYGRDVVARMHIFEDLIAENTRRIGTEAFPLAS
jgi:hypothetical protein